MNDHRKLPVLFDCPYIKVKLRPEVCGRRWALAHDRVKARNAQDRSLAKQVQHSPCRTCDVGEQNLTVDSDQPVGPQDGKPSAVHTPKRRPGRPPKTRPPPTDPPMADPREASSPPPQPAPKAPTVRVAQPPRTTVLPPATSAPAVVVPSAAPVPREVTRPKAKAPKEERRTIQVAVALTASEAKRLNERATAANMSRAKWLLPYVLAAIGVSASISHAQLLEQRIVELEARVRKLEGTSD